MLFGSFFSLPRLCKLYLIFTISAVIFWINTFFLPIEIQVKFPYIVNLFLQLFTFILPIILFIYLLIFNIHKRQIANLFTSTGLSVLIYILAIVFQSFLLLNLQIPYQEFLDLENINITYFFIPMIFSIGFLIYKTLFPIKHFKLHLSASSFLLALLSLLFSLILVLSILLICSLGTAVIFGGEYTNILTNTLWRFCLILYLFLVVNKKLIKMKKLKHINNFRKVRKFLLLCAVFLVFLLFFSPILAIILINGVVTYLILSYGIWQVLNLVH